MYNSSTQGFRTISGARLIAIANGEKIRPVAIGDVCMAAARMLRDDQGK